MTASVSGPEPVGASRSESTDLAAGPGVLERPTTRPIRDRRLILAVLCVSLLLVSLDNTILNVALPVIVRTLHATSSSLQWIVDSYAIVFAGLLLVAGSLGDRLGRKWVFMAGLALFSAGSAVSAFSGTADRLIAARAFMGIGGAAIMPSTLSILTSTFTEARERARAIGIWSGTTGLGVAVGPVAGGWLLAHFWWGSVFLVNVPIAVVGLLRHHLARAQLEEPQYQASRPDRLLPLRSWAWGCCYGGSSKHRTALGPRPSSSVPSRPRSQSWPRSWPGKGTRRTRCSRSPSSNRGGSRRRWEPWASSCSR